MTDTGLIYATNASNNAAVGTVAWSNTSNCIGSSSTAGANANGSVFNLTTNYLQYDYSPGLSSGDTIVGFKFAFRRATDGVDGTDSAINMLVNGTYSPTTKGGQSWPNGSSTNLNWSADYGGATDMWGYPAGSLNGGMSFSAVVSCEIGDKHDSAYIGIARLTIYYTTASGAQKKATMFFRLME